MLGLFAFSPHAEKVIVGGCRFGISPGLHRLGAVVSAFFEGLERTLKNSYIAENTAVDFHLFSTGYIVLVLAFARGARRKLGVMRVPFAAAFSTGLGSAAGKSSIQG